MPDAATLDRARALHERAIIIDGHSDILMAIADHKMRLGTRVELPPHDGWQAPMGWAETEETQLYNFSPHTAYFQTMGHYDIPRFREGGLTSQAMAIFIDSAHLDRALHRTLEMVGWLRREAEENPDFALVRTVADPDRIQAEGITSAFITVEGVEPLE